MVHTLISRLTQQFLDTLSLVINFIGALSPPKDVNQRLKNLLSSTSNIFSGLVREFGLAMLSVSSATILSGYIVNGTLTPYKVLTRSTTSPYARVWVGFDLPDCWQHWLAVAFFKFPFIHTRLMIEHPLDESFTVTNVELTHDGWHIVHCSNAILEQVEVGDHRDNALVFELHYDKDELIGILEGIYRMTRLDVRWSNWFIFEYLRSGKMPGLTCSSIIGHILRIPQVADTPKELFAYLEELNRKEDDRDG